MKTEINPTKELSLRTIYGNVFFDYAQIVRFEADGNYSLVYELNNTKPEKILCSLSDIEKKLTGCCCKFYRCHRSHIINVKHLKQFIEKTRILVTEQGKVSISESNIKEFKEKFCR